jgi:heme exporter protein A
MTSANAFAPRAVRVSGLTLRRGEADVISGLSFGVEPGAVLLIRGPNGAGKSTLLLALAGLLRPDAGLIDLSATKDERSATLLHFLGHLSAVRPHLSLRETLRFWADLLGARLPEEEGPRVGGRAVSSGGTPTPNPSPQGGGEAADAVSVALDRVGLGGLEGNDAGHLSQGQTRRLALARLLIAERPIWLLDEPTAALDTGGEALVGRLVAEHCAADGTVIAATHDDLHLAGLKVDTLRLGDA